MRSYLNIMRNIISSGLEKAATRKETDAEMPTIGLPNQHLCHSLSRGFPLITTRRVPWRQTFGELRAFLDGCITQQQFEQRGCSFWKQWARADGSLGPIYGYQWNAHGQLGHVLECLRERPTDRRMVVSAWRPDEHEDMVLPPCHLMWVATPYGGKLNLSWIQRSCDWPVGVPHNIASYALLARLLALWGRMKLGTIDCIFCDAHIYKDQIEKAKEQIERRPLELPDLEIRQSNTDFFDWEAKVVNYDPHPAIDYEVTV